MRAHVAPEHARIDVIAAARTVADDERDLLAAIKIGDILGVRRRRDSRHRCGNPNKFADTVEVHRKSSHGDGRKPAL